MTPEINDHESKREQSDSKPELAIGRRLVDRVRRAVNEDWPNSPLAAVRDELAESRGVWPGEIPVYVMPAWQTDTFAAMFTKDRVLLRLSRKAWWFWWESEEEMAGELTQWYAAAEAALREPSSLSQDDRRDLMDVLGALAVILPASPLLDVAERERLRSAIERLHGLV